MENNHSDDISARIAKARAALKELLDLRVLPPKQFRAAYLLGFSFGHAWAIALHRARMIMSDGIPASGLTLQAICEIATRECPTGGILAPVVCVETGEVRHVSTTGRHVWAVAPDGSVTVWITRPAEQGEIRVSIDAAGKPGTHRCTGDLYARHFAALERALQSLMGDDAAASCTAEVQTAYFDGLLTQTYEVLREQVFGPPLEPPAATEELSGGTVPEVFAEPDSTL